MIRIYNYKNRWIDSKINPKPISVYSVCVNFGTSLQASKDENFEYFKNIIGTFPGFYFHNNLRGNLTLLDTPFIIQVLTMYFG